MFSFETSQTALAQPPPQNGLLVAATIATVGYCSVARSRSKRITNFSPFMSEPDAPDRLGGVAETSLPLPIQLHTIFVNPDTDPCNPVPAAALAQNTLFWPLVACNTDHLLGIIKTHPSQSMIQTSIEMTALNARVLTRGQQSPMNAAELVRNLCVPLGAMLALLDSSNAGHEQDAK